MGGESNRRGCSLNCVQMRQRRTDFQEVQCVCGCGECSACSIRLNKAKCVRSHLLYSLFYFRNYMKGMMNPLQ